jgi:hypothetical protein
MRAVPGARAGSDGTIFSSDDATQTGTVDAVGTLEGLFSVDGGVSVDGVSVAGCVSGSGSGGEQDESARRASRRGMGIRVIPCMRPRVWWKGPKAAGDLDSRTET